VDLPKKNSPTSYQPKTKGNFGQASFPNGHQTKTINARARAKSSRGPSDIKAQKGSKKWVIQVKASRKKVIGNRISSDELRRLKIQARKARATPVLARVTRGAVQYCSARINRKLKP
jgi:Holliday junction resolvase